MIGELVDMLAFRREAGGHSERAFINRYLRPIAGIVQDDFGNLIADRRPGKGASIMWSSHTDSVHAMSGTQRVEIIGNYAMLPIKTKSNCLGADNAVGVWIMLQMIRADVPGLYIFHREEECGGRGSSYIRKHHTDLLAGLTHAIAFDRRGTTSIITHQGGSRTASEAFALDMARRLDMGHKPDSGGTFTDTANYEDVVPECTNISAGFKHEHSSNESCDLVYAGTLANRMVNTDWSTLTCERDPKAVEYDGLPWWQEYDKYGTAEDRALEVAEMARLIETRADDIATELRALGYSIDDLRDWCR